MNAPSPDVSRSRKYDSGPIATDPFLIPGTRVDYVNADVSQLTSAGLGSLKDLIMETRARKAEIEQETKSAGWQLFGSQIKFVLAFVFLVGILIPKFRRSLQFKIDECKLDILNLKQNLTNTKVAIDFDMDSEVAAPVNKMQSAFEEMSKSAAVWSVATEQKIDKVKARSWAGSVVSRVPVRFWRASYPLVDTQMLPLALGTLQKQNVIYLYPGFLLVIGPSDFALIDILEVQAAFSITKFQESGTVPSDGQILGYAWAKSNKDGSRDRRFSDNRQIPILQYGAFYMVSSSGVNTAYMVSQAKPCFDFISALDEVKRRISLRQNLVND